VVRVAVHDAMQLGRAVLMAILSAATRCRPSAVLQVETPWVRGELLWLQAADATPGEEGFETLPRTPRQFDNGPDTIAVLRATALLLRL